MNSSASSTTGSTRKSIRKLSTEGQSGPSCGLGRSTPGGHGKGLCGENARLALTFLGLGGVRAHRLYLHGERWEHCMVEAQWRGRWVAFDGHEDQKLRMTDDQIGHIPSDRLGDFPNAARRNKWLRAVRFKPLLRLPPTVLDRLRPPRLVVRVAESPDLLCAASAAMVAFAIRWTDRVRSR